MSPNPKPTGQVLEEVGYGTIVQDPKRITESEGFKKALNDLGLTQELIATSLVSDIKEKPKNRVKELSLGADILGMKKTQEPPQEVKNTYNFILDPGFREKMKPLEEALKEQFKHVQTTQNTENSLENDEEVQ